MYVCMYGSGCSYPHLVCRSVPCRLVTGSFFCSLHNHLWNRSTHPCAVHALFHQHPVQPVAAASAVCCGRSTKQWLSGCHLLPPHRLPPVCCPRTGRACAAAGSRRHRQPTTRRCGRVYYCLPFPRPGRQSLAAERTPVTSIFND